MTAALGRALLELETGERTIVSAPQATVRSPAATAEPTELPEPTAAASEPTAAMSEPTAAMSEPTAVMREPGATVAQPPARRSRRSPVLWALSIAALAVAAVVVVVLSGGSKTAGAGPDPRERPDAGADDHGIGTRGFDFRRDTERLGLATRPGRDRPFQRGHGAQQTFPAAGSPTAIAAGVSAVWVAEPGLQALAQFNGDSGERVHSAKLPGTPVALALDQQDSSAWVADSSGAITHVAVGGTVAGTPGIALPRVEPRVGRRLGVGHQRHEQGPCPGGSQHERFD